MNIYKCYYEACSKNYNSKYNLIRHVNSYHLDNKSYACSSCGRGFYNKQCLDAHVYTKVCGVLVGVHSGKGLLGDLSFITDLISPHLQETPPLSLPALPRVEEDRQVPLSMAKLPIVSTIFRNHRTQTPREKKK